MDGVLDTSMFPVGQDIDYESDEELKDLEVLTAEAWADNVLADADLSDSYPIPVAPTREHAEMLLGRVEFIRQELIPLAV